MRKSFKWGIRIALCLWCLLLFSGCGQLREYLGQKSDDNTVASHGETDDSVVVRDQYEGAPDIGAQAQVQSISNGNYAYEHLSEEGKQVYDQMLAAILDYQEKVNLATMDTELMKDAYQALNCDYGGLFWTDGYVFTTYMLGEEPISLEFSPTYIMEKSEKDAIQGQVDAVVDEWLGGISIQDSDYEKAKYVFETLIERVDYVEGSKDNQNILSVFLHGETVCQGYACATQYLLRQLGIPSLIITGTANNQAHAWNIVELDGKYYHMDTTWGNSTYLNTEQQEAKYVNYNFLCMTDEEIGRTHQVQMGFVLPECNSMEHDYYVVEGRYFDSWDPGRIGSVLREAWESGNPSVDIKLKDAELYEQMKDYFIQQQKIVDYCDGIEYVYYMEAPDVCVFTVNFEEK